MLIRHVVAAVADMVACPVWQIAIRTCSNSAIERDRQPLLALMIDVVSDNHYSVCPDMRHQ